MPLPKRRRGPLRKALAWTWKLVLLLVVATALPVVALRFVAPPTTAFMLQRGAEHAQQGLAPVQHAWVDLDRVSRDLQLAVIVAEDQKFPEHHGFDLGGIEQALREREQTGRLRGASTLTQQVAKNLFLWPGRNLVRKGLEAWFTVLIETAWPKRRILEIYVNVAEFGPGVFGAGAASETYFERSAAELEPEQAALLAACLPNPRRLRAWDPGPYTQERAREILGLMQELRGQGWLSKL